MSDLQRRMKRFELLRTANIKAIESVPIEKTEIIPPGLRNHIHWQAGHLVVVQMSLAYRRCGLQMPLTSNLSKAFGKGSSPAVLQPLAEAFFHAGGNHELRNQLAQATPAGAAVSLPRGDEVCCIGKPGQ